MKLIKLCEICHKAPAEVPDRDRPGKPINRICTECHAAKLAGDLKKILQQTNTKVL